MRSTYYHNRTEASVVMVAIPLRTNAEQKKKKKKSKKKRNIRTHHRSKEKFEKKRWKKKKVGAIKQKKTWYAYADFSI